MCNSFRSKVFHGISVRLETYCISLRISLNKFLGQVAGHVIGHGAHLGPRRLAPLLAMCYMISMGSSPVKIPVTVRHFRLYTSESYLT